MMSETAPFKSNFFEYRQPIANNIVLSILADNHALEITYHQLHSYVEELANYLESNVVQDLHDKLLIFIECRNQLSVIVGYLYALKFGHCALMVDANLDPTFKSELLTRYKPNLRFTPALNNAYPLPCIDELSKTKIPLHKDLAVLLSTSGSTGSPKQVRLSFSNLKSNADSICQYLRLDENENAITSLPMSYSYGLSVINSHLNCGAKLILSQDSVISKGFWEVFKLFGATSFAGVPHQFKMLSQIRFENMALPTLRTITQAGGKMSEELIKSFHDYARSRDIQFFVMYGQTEATARMSYVPPNVLSQVIGSIGIVIPGGRLSLIDEQGELIQENERVGELVYEGANVMMGYANSLDDLSRGFEVGNLKTGDLAFRNKDGYFFISGRKNRIAKIYGQRIDLSELETQLNKLLNHQLACIELEEHLFICIEQAQEGVIDLNKIKAYLRDTLKLHSAVFTIDLISSFPRTPNGKISFSDLKKQITAN